MGSILGSYVEVSTVWGFCCVLASGAFVFDTTSNALVVMLLPTSHFVFYSNSLPASFNLSYDHGDYRERVDQNKDFFEKLHLKSMYKNSALTGF